MRAVNLLPPDHRKAKGSAGLRGPGFVVVGMLALALLMVTYYVITNNSVSDQRSKLAALQQELPQVQAVAARLGAYSQFSSLAQQRAQTVRSIASTRFDWAASMSDLAKVVPAGTSLQALTATAGTGSSGGSGATGSSSSSNSGIRTALPNPAFELKGCTNSQDDVARLLSRLRLMTGVARVTLSTAAKASTAGAATAASGSAPVSGTGSAAGSKCPDNKSAFDVVVFFSAPGGAAPSAAGGTTSSQPAAAATKAAQSSGSTP